MENKIVEIWIRGRKLCVVDSNNEALEGFEQIVAKAGYTINEKEEDGKVIKMV